METESFGSGGGQEHMGIQRGHLKKKRFSTCDLGTLKPKKKLLMSPLDLQCVQTHPCSVQYFVFS